MPIAVSVVSVRENKAADVKNFLKSFEAIDIYGVSEDKTRILIVTDTENNELENLCEKIRENDDVIDILQHSFYYDDEETES